MDRYNDGLIFTNDNCIRCGRCISQCPVMGANSTVMNKNRGVIEVDPCYCINCGHCIDVCKHNARDYQDDTDRFLNDLKSGKRISLAVSRSFYEVYRDDALRTLSYLRSIGAQRIYDVSLGIDISAWLHLEYFRRNSNNRNRAFVSSACPAVNNYITKCIRGAADSLIPLQSPLVCLGIYAKKYLSDGNPIASLGPCIAMKGEIEDVQIKDYIHYSVTVERLMSRLSDIDLSKYPAAPLDMETIGYGQLGCTRGGLQRYLEYLTGDMDALAHGVSPVESVESFRVQIEGLISRDLKPLFLDVTSCPNGCLASPATTGDKSLLVNALCEKLSSKSKANFLSGNITADERRARLYEAFADLKYEDFTRSFTEKYVQRPALSDDVYEEVFASMYKDTEKSRRINCHLCGYDSCADMAAAIAYGYSQREDCIQYAKERIARLNSHDALTGLFKEGPAVEKAIGMLERNPEKNYVLVFAKINYLKVINEVYGFDTTDKVLRFFAAKLKSMALEDGICARVGSGSAIAFIPDRSELDHLFDGKKYYDMRALGMDMRLTVTIVLYELKNDDKNLRHAIGAASLACKSVSETSNCVVRYNDKMRIALENETKITSQMHLALANNEFKAFLQPQFNHATGELSGAEVLCRWIKDDKTLIMPGIFIPIFEKNGFIRELDKYMWEKTFALMREWLDKGLEPVDISTNISRISLSRETIVDDFEALISKYHIAPKHIHLEITESAFIDNEEQIVSVVTRLRDMGFIIAIDDFGSGYSSLNTLKDVPFDILKLDMGFFRGGDTSSKSGNIVSSVLRMANSLKVISIAEGVEKTDQAEYLKSLGCNIIQGYLYSKPVPADEYEKLLIASKTQKELQRPTIMEYIDINSFSDPSSGESRMFNNYIGPAAMIEHIGHTVEIVRINDKYIDIIGARGKEFADTVEYITRQLSRSDREDFAAAIKQAIDSDRESTCIIHIKNATSGKMVCIRNHFHVIARNGDIEMLYCLADDITNEKNTEETLLVTNKRLNLILDNSHVGMCLYSFEVSPKGIDIVPMIVNKTFHDISSYSFDDLSKMDFKHFMEIVHPDDRGDMVKHGIQALLTTRKFHCKYRAYSKDTNKYQWVEVSANAVKEEGGTFLVLMSFTNIGN